MDKLLSGRRILVVEDEMLVLIMIEDMLADRDPAPRSREQRWKVLLGLRRMQGSAMSHDLAKQLGSDPASIARQLATKKGGSQGTASTFVMP